MWESFRMIRFCARVGAKGKKFVSSCSGWRRSGAKGRGRELVAKSPRGGKRIRTRALSEYGERWMLSGLVTIAEPGPMQLNRPRYNLNVEPTSARFLSGGHGPSLVSWCLRGRRACFDILGRGLENFPDAGRAFARPHPWISTGTSGRTVPIVFAHRHSARGGDQRNARGRARAPVHGVSESAWVFAPLLGASARAGARVIHHGHRHERQCGASLRDGDRVLVGAASFRESPTAHRRLRRRPC